LIDVDYRQTFSTPEDALNYMKEIFEISDKRRQEILSSYLDQRLIQEIVKERFAALMQQICEKFFISRMKMLCMTLYG